MKPYTYVYSGKIIEVSIGQTEGVRVNDLCLQKQQRCAAIRVYHAPSQVNKIHNAKDSNFSGAYCELLHGTQLFLHRDQEGESQFCVFSDLTMIDAKALYGNHMKRTKGK